MGQDIRMREMKLNWEEIESMAMRFAPPEEIRDSLGITERQFRQAIRAKYRKSVDAWCAMFYARGRYLVRQKQFDRATQGDGHPVLLKWLGIQYLGQRESVDVIHKAAPGTNGDAESAEKAAREKGFAILTPEGQVVLDDRKQINGPQDEVPAVEAIILEEKAESTAPKPTAPADDTIVVEAYPVPK